MAPMSGAIPPPITISALPTIETPNELDDYYDNSGRDNFNRFAYSQSVSQSTLTVSAVHPDHEHDHKDGTRPFYDPKRLSPVAPTFQNRNTLLVPEMASNMDDDFSNENAAPIDIPKSNAPNPFNFQTQVISTSPVKPNVGQRRGHKYKHSSVSAQHPDLPRAPAPATSRLAAGSARADSQRDLEVNVQRPAPSPLLVYMPRLCCRLAVLDCPRFSHHDGTLAPGVLRCRIRLDLCGG
ncbi:hypothetical protein NUW58_g10297 [Xylaria curta]|uniref:Uncharacterized protein n=1 Tax=Xylaria curta TaxID=42375 RepID=A0ACC1MMQ5_9PEZI|nr:hypothetical protein NUW58_g10297 [Xylaria curta]